MDYCHQRRRPNRGWAAGNRQARGKMEGKHCHKFLAAQRLGGRCATCGKRRWRPRACTSHRDEADRARKGGVRLRLAYWVAPTPGITVGLPRTAGVPARRSKSRTPEPRRTGTMSRWISSRSPAFRHCWMVSAPWTPTDFPAAAVLAWFTALSIPSVTKWTVELGRGQPAGMWWVRTNAGPQA